MHWRSTPLSLQGVWEKDEARKHDSFQAFDEVLELWGAQSTRSMACASACMAQPLPVAKQVLAKAVELDVDLVLLGGDLFHENKPSRTTIVKAISSLKRHCFHSRDISFRILSNQAENFVSGCVAAPLGLAHAGKGPLALCRVANTEDSSQKVGLPVFTIHGNHDDPSGVDNLSAVDILSSCGLVNYFGKTVRGSGRDPRDSACRDSHILGCMGADYLWQQPQPRSRQGGPVPCAGGQGRRHSSPAAGDRQCCAQPLAPLSARGGGLTLRCAGHHSGGPVRVGRDSG
jgi:double-strand break repair protein MRE11